MGYSDTLKQQARIPNTSMIHYVNQARQALVISYIQDCTGNLNVSYPVSMSQKSWAFGPRALF